MTPSTESLILPKGVRLANAEEIPGCTDEILARIANASFHTGWIVRSTDANGYAAYIEANIHAPMVWDVFEAMATALLPDVAAPIVGWKGDDPTLGPYTDKAAAISALKPHRDRLQDDGFIEFGLMFQHQGVTEEVFVTSAKYLQIWTNHPDIAKALLLSKGIPEVGSLLFLDELPRVTEALSNGPSTDEVINSILNSFNSLPDR
jgi:hypothetical protein